MSRRRSGDERPAWFVAACLVSVALWGAAIFVAWHFIAKWW